MGRPRQTAAPWTTSPRTATGGESAGGLPRTGLEVAGLAMIGLGLLMAGLALRPTSSWPPPRDRLKPFDPASLDGFATAFAAGSAVCGEAPSMGP